MLMKDESTGKLFVRKTMKIYDISIYDYLYKNRPFGIPIVYSFEEMNGCLIVVEEYINGTTLATKIAEMGPPNYETGLFILKEVCKILSPLHSNNPSIVHRDIKPSNIIITDSGTVYLLDFNAATHFHESKDRDTVLIGTTGYAAPEQYGFKASDSRADVYAIGRTAQELFIGEKPLPEDYHGPLADIIRKCLQMNPEDRYTNASELLSAIQKQTGKFPFASKLLFNEDVRRIHRASWLPPGFRTRTPWKIVLSALFYFIFIFSILSNIPKKTPGEFVGDLIAFGFLLCEVFFIFNYKDIQSRLPLTRSQELLSKIIGYVVYILLIYLITVILYNLLDSLFTLS